MTLMKDVKKKDKWIQEAVPDENKGLLRKKLKTKKGNNIPVKKLDKAAHSKNSKLAKEANFVLTMRKLKK